MAKTSNPLFNQTSGKIGSLVITDKGIVRERVYHNASQSALQVRQRANLSGLAQSWRQQPQTTMNQWAGLEAQMNMVKTANPSGFLTYMQINGTLLACGKPVAQTVPASPAPPPLLPPLSIIAEYSSGAFQLLIQSAAYANMVQVYASAPASPGRNSFRSSDLKLIGTVSALLAGSTTCTALYTARFPAPLAGQKVAVRLSPVSAQGFRGSPIETMTATTLAAAAAPSAAETQAQTALKAA